MEQFRQVGEFPDPRRRLIRHPKNSLDRCTVVSILQKDIDEIKPTIEPGRFIIPAGTYESPSVLTVGPSSWWKDVGVDQPMIEIPNSSNEIARSIVVDYCNGMFGCNMADAMPGLFYVEGTITALKIKSDYKNKLDEAKVKQDKWFFILVQAADALWSRSDQNPLAISNEMRLAAKSLGIDDKPWLKDYQIIKMQRCTACGSMRDPSYPVCPVCRFIDPEHPMIKGKQDVLKFAV